MVHDAAAEGYAKQATTYHRARPSYHPDLLERLASVCGVGPIIDLGAGSGIFTRQLVDARFTVTAVEPVAEMRDTLTSAVPEAVVADGTAEHIPHTAASVDRLVAAQAFHWFDHRPALDEIDRVLRPDGYLATAWNVRDETVPWVSAITRAVDRHQGDAPRYRTMDWKKAIDADRRFDLVDDWSVENPQAATGASVVDRVLSTSFIAALSPADQASVVQEVREIVANLGPSFEYPYVSRLVIWRKVASAAPVASKRQSGE